MRPALFVRLALSWLAWRGRRSKGRRQQPPPIDRIPPIPASPLASGQLRRIRRALGRPSFPQRLSALRVRRWVEIMVPGGEGTCSARLYRPRGKVGGVVLFLHGGGFVHCDTVSHHGICCRLAAFSGAMVLSLDYRLAPEHRFPAALDDAKAALSWLARAAPGLPLAVAGDSAGGTLAAALAHWSRAGLGPPLAAQFLLYPALSGPVIPWSRREFAEGYMLTVEVMYWYCGQALAGPEQLFDPDFAPVLAPSFEGLPPAMIVNAGFDPLRGEGELYAFLLRRAGVAVRCRLFAGMIHGFLNLYPFLRDGRTALREGGAFLKRQFLRERRFRERRFREPSGGTSRGCPHRSGGCVPSGPP